jgi:hypothetical protein
MAKTSDKQIAELLERHQYAVDSWAENYKQGDEDLKALIEGPWPEAEKSMRKKQGRPCLHFDELTQYVNQRVNDVRQNKRAIKLDPAGGGATAETAELRASIIRTIESRGGVQAYITGFENAIQRNIGFWAVGKRWADDDSFNMELYLRHFPNSKNVIIDPDTKEPAAADMKYGFIVEDIPRKEFARRWPKAQLKDFAPDLMQAHRYWIKEQTIQVAEYWYVDMKPAKLLLVGPESKPYTLWEDQLEENGCTLQDGGVLLPNGLVVPILRDRTSQRRTVKMQLTNGLEILEETDWEGKYIPIIVCFGRQYWLDTGSGSKRVLRSLIHGAIASQMAHDYTMTGALEAMGQMLKTPYIGYEGQIEGHEREWEMANKRPLSILLVKPVLDATGTAVLPLPQRNNWDPAIQNNLIFDEAAKRGMQNAMGAYSANAVKADAAGKSGRALQRQEMMADQGSYHFLDNFDEAIRHTGVILDDLIPHIYDTAREILLRKPDDTAESVTINAPVNKNGKMERKDARIGRHDVTISVGPAYQSQREIASDFVDRLTDNLAALPFDPVVKGKLLALGISIKQLGPLGDEMTEILDPSRGKEEDVNALKAQLEKMVQMVKAQSEALNRMSQEREAKAEELQHKERIEQMKVAAQVELKRMELEAKQALEQNRLQQQASLETIKQEMSQLQMHLNTLMQASKMEQDASVKREQMAAAQQAAQAQMAQKQQQMQMAAQQQQAAQAPPAQPAEQGAPMPGGAPPGGPAAEPPLSVEL